VYLTKVDEIEKKQVDKLVKKAKQELHVGDVTPISSKSNKNMHLVKNQVLAWNGNRIIILGVFNSGKTSVINWVCGTDHKVGDIPGTTLEFTETKLMDATLIDSVGQLIDINKPMMVSIDFSECENIIDKIDKVFDEESKGVLLTKDHVRKSLRKTIDGVKVNIQRGFKIIVTGAGASALVAKEIAGQGTECGFPIMVFTNDSAEVQPISFSKGLGEQEGGLARYISNAINSHDVVIGVSASGGTGFVNDVLRRGKEKDATTIAITENADTPMGKYADYILKSEAKPEGPSSSKIQTSHLVIGHAFMLVLADEMGVTADESVGYMLPEFVETKKMGIK